MSALTRKLLRDFWGLRGQALAIAMVIAGGIATWVISFSTIDSLQLTRDAYYREGRFAEVFADLKRAPQSMAARIAAIPGVKRVETRTLAAANLEVAGFGDPVTGLLVSLPEQGQPLLNQVYLRAGRLPLPDSDDEVVIAAPFAEAHGLGPGDTLVAVINGRRDRLRVVGVGLSPEFLYQIRPGDFVPDYKRYGILWMRRDPLAAAQGMTNAFNNVILTLQPGIQPEEVVDRLDRLLGRYGGAGAYARADQTSNKYLVQELTGLKSMAGVVPAIFLGVAAFLINVVVGRIIEQQREQVAILKAFGYHNRVIGAHYLALVMLIVALGAVPGIALGAWLGHGMSQIYSDFFRFPFLHYYLMPGVVLSAVAVGALAALVGALRAVRAAIHLPPAEAMRPEPPANYRATLVERLGMQRLFDQPTRMVLRHLERKPGKALFSIVGIGMAGAILLVGLFQEDAIDYMVDVQFNLAQRENLTVTFNEITARRALYELAEMPGVNQAEPFRAVPVELVAGHRRYRTAIQGFEAGAQLHRALDAKRHPIPMPRAGMLLTDYIGYKLGIKAGDRVTVRVLEGPRPVRSVVVTALVSEFIGTSGYMELGALNRMMGDGDVISGAFLAVDSARQQNLFDRLKLRPRVAGVTIREVAIKSFYDTMGDTLLIFAFVNTLLAGSIAFGVIYNSARITLSEHGRELASLRVLGFTRGEIAYILLGELAVLTLVSLPVGFFIGREFCRLLVTQLASELYRVPLIIENSSYGIAASVVLFSALVSALIVRRRLYRLDLVAVLKTRE